MEKVVRIIGLKEEGKDREFWLSRPAADRIAAVETLRRQFTGSPDGSSERLQRVLAVTRRQRH